MTNQIQTHLEKVFKEYLDVKNFLEVTQKRDNLDAIKKEVAEKSLTFETDEQILDFTFEKMGWIEVLQQDLTSLTVRLYHTYEAYKNAVEIPQEIKEQIEKELGDIKFTLTYSVKGDQVDVVDKQALEFYKKAFKENYSFLKEKVK